MICIMEQSGQWKLLELQNYREKSGEVYNENEKRGWPIYKNLRTTPTNRQVSWFKSLTWVFGPITPGLKEGADESIKNFNIVSEPNISPKESFLVPVWVILSINLIWDDYFLNLISPCLFRITSEGKCWSPTLGNT